MIGALYIAFEKANACWRIDQARGTDPARLCIGLRPEEAVCRVSTLFSLCGAAHAEAASVALGLAEPRAILSPAMRREILRDHALAFLLELPRHLGFSPARDQLAALARMEGDKDDPGTFRQALTGTKADIGSFGESELADWLARGSDPDAPLILSVLDWVRREIAPEWGRVTLPPLVTTDIESAFTSETSLEPCEATILADHAERPVLRHVLRREGPTLFARLLARLLDLLACLDPEGVTGGPPPMPGGMGRHIGFARAARGLLAHKAEVVKGRIVSYAILSPTFWNVAPRGLLPSMLATLPSGPRQGLLARLVLASVNPCVPVTLAEA